MIFYYLLIFLKTFPIFVHIVVLIILLISMYFVWLAGQVLCDHYWKKFQDRSNIPESTHINPVNMMTFDIPLDYKILNIKQFMCKISFSIFVLIIVFLFLRYKNLTKSLNVSGFIFKFMLLSLPHKIIFIIFAIFLLFLVASFWRYLFAAFAKDLKKLYIYLFLYGGTLDPKSDYYNPKVKDKYDIAYINRYFLNPLHEISASNLHITILSVINYPTRGWFKYTAKIKDPEKFDLKISLKRLSHLWYYLPLHYFIVYSKYKDTLLGQSLKYILYQYAWLAPKLHLYSLYGILYFTIIYELYTHPNDVHYFYYILFILFIYKNYYNLTTFREKCANDYLIKVLCLLYYKPHLTTIGYDYKCATEFEVNLIKSIMGVFHLNWYDELIGLLFLDFDFDAVLVHTKFLSGKYEPDLVVWFNKKIKSRFSKVHEQGTLGKLNRAYSFIFKFWEKE